MIKTHSGLKSLKVENKTLKKTAKAAAFGAMDRKAVMGVGAP